MTDRRVRELPPGEEDNPSIMVEESCEDADDLFEMIANRNKLKDNDIEALPAGSDDDFLLGDDTADNSTESLPENPKPKEAEPSVEIEDDLPKEEVSKPAASPSKSQSPSHESPKVPSPRTAASPKPSSPKPSSPPTEPKRAPPPDPVNEWAERRKREEMEKDREEAEKRELLIRFFEFEESGVPCPKRYTMKSDIVEMRFEAKKLDDEFNRTKTIKIWKEGAKLASSFIEVLNKKFDPIGWKSTDFAENLNMALSESDWALKELHKKYFRKGGKPSPEIFLAFIIGSTAVNTHKANAKREEKHQEKNAQAQYQMAPPYPMYWPPYPPGYGPPPGYAAHPPPPGYGGPPPMFWQGRQQPPPGPQPGQQPQRPPNGQQHPQQQRPTNMPPQQQQPQPQQQPPQQRPTIIPGAQAIPGTSPTMTYPKPMPQVDISRVAEPVAAPMPAPTMMPTPPVGFNPNAGNPPQPPTRRFIPPPSSAGGQLGDLTRVMGSLAGQAAPTPPVRKTSNYSQPEQEEESPAEEEPEPAEESSSQEQPSTSSKRRTGPLEPPKNASRVRVVDGKVVFE